MYAGMLDILKTRYRFDEWRRALQNRERFFVHNFRVTGNELPDRLVRSRTARLSTVRRLNTSIWVPPVKTVERPLVIDALEHPSGEKAQQALLELIAQFHRPVSLDVRTNDVGDVSIATPGRSWFAFTRGNLLVRITSGYGLINPARSVAERLDADLISKPKRIAPRRKAEPAEIFGTGQPSSRGAMRLAMADIAEEADVPLDEQQCMKIFSRGGSIVFEDMLVFVPEQSEVEIDVFTGDPRGQWTHRHFQGAPGQTPRGKH
jgi:hypothetical protein